MSLTALSPIIETLEPRLYLDSTLYFIQDSGSDGLVSMEAENYNTKADNVGSHSWTLVSPTPSGTSGTAYQAMPNTGTTVNTGYVTGSPALNFSVNFVKTGTHYIWIRGKAAKSADDTLHAGLDGQTIASADRIQGFNNSYAWSKNTMDSAVATIDVATTGTHTFNIYMREDGFIIDKIVLTTNSGYTPTGTGPAESSRQDLTAPGAISNLTAPSSDSSSVTLNWTAPGDDGSTGTAASYDIRYSTSTITDANWASATPVTGEPTPAAAGTAQSMTVSGLNASTTYYFAMKTSDEVPNTSALSNVVSKATSAPSSNLLTNGSFETGSLSNWTTSGGTFTVDTTTPQSGSYDARHAGVTTADQFLWQGSINLTGGTLYTMTAYYRVDTASTAATEGWRNAELGFYPSGGPGWGNHLAFTNIDDNNNTAGWVAATVTYTPAANTTVSIGFCNWQTDAIYRLDNLTVVAGTAGDTTAPAGITNLATSNPTTSAITLNWTAPGDDGSTGTAATYDVRYSTSPITDANWGSATQATGEPTPAAAGTNQSMTVSGLSADTTYYFAIKTADEVPNTSAISNVPSAKTSDATAPAGVTTLATSNPLSDRITLTWTAPGDNGSTGTAASYDIRYSTSTITDANWASATQCTGEPTPAAAGTGQSFTVTGLSASTTYYFAIKTADEVPNTSALSNVPSAATTAATIFSDDFQGETTGLIPSQWSHSAGTGFQVRDESGQKMLYNAGSDDHAWPTDCDTNPSNWANFEMTARVRDMRYLDFRNAGGNMVRLEIATGRIYLANTSLDKSLTAATWYRMRLYANGTSVKVRFWLDGSSEPSSWDIDTTTTVTQGGRADFNWQNAISIDDVLVTPVGAQVDSTAPANITNLAAGSPGAGALTLTWTAPGDDGSTGTAASYDIRYSTSTITDANWASASQVTGEPTPAAAGTNQSMTVSGLAGNTTYYFAIKTADEVPNTSGLSNVASGTTGATTITNLLTNGNIEAGSMTGWTADAGATAVTNIKHAGTYAARITGTSTAMSQNLATTVGTQYKATVWVKIDQQTGTDWGGFIIDVSDSGGYVTRSGYLDQATSGSGWFQYGVSFTARQTSTNLKFSNFMGGNKSLTVYCDDAMFFQKPATNTLPTISAGSITPTSFTSLGGTQDFSVAANDPDGAITRVVWKFGDGDQAFTASGSRRISQTGSYTATAYVVDDDNGISTQTYTWSATDATYPTLGVTSPPAEVSTSSLTLNGTASGSSPTIKISSDRNNNQIVTATGSATWNANVPLAPGYNRLTIQAVDAEGQITTQEAVVRYNPSGALSVTNLSNASSVERWDQVEVGFTLNNSAATNTQFPYTDPANEVQGLEWVDGITVDGVFWNTASPSVTYRRPGFLYQDYTREQHSAAGTDEWLNPNGAAVWKVRFSPPSTGTWNYRIEVTEAKGSAQSSNGSFTVNTPTDTLNHGPIAPAANDSRYFEYADGTPFLGNGHGIGFSSTWDATSRLNTIGDDNENFFRWWTSGQMWGSSWDGWRSMNIGYDGNVPYSGRSTDSAYASGVAALKLESSEWLKYTFNASNTTTYTIQTRLASPSDSKKFHIEIDGTNVTGTITAPNTGGWQTWQTVTSNSFSLSSGSHTMRVVMDTGGYNLNWFKIVPTSGTTVTLEAENYNTGGQDVGYHDLTPGNSAGAYKTDDVDIQATTDTGGGYNVTGIDPSNSIMEQSWGTGEASVIPGHTYKIRVRWRGENITGPADTSYSTYGMAIKSFGWVGEPSTYNHQLPSAPVLVANEKGDTPWHVSEGTYTIPAGQYTLPFGFILENTITGTAYIDEVGVYEDLGGGNLGANILRTPKFNSTMDFDPRGAYAMDYILNAAESHGMSMKVVIEEKQDWSLNHMGKDGLPQPYGGQFNSQAGTANWQLQEWYWRRLFGQFGAYRSVHSWELANEEEPNNMSHLRNVDHLADLADSDGNPHMASTSFWSGLSDTGWKDPASSNIQFTDFHCYTPGTDWLGNDDALAKDLAQWYRDHDTAVANAGFDKPTIAGEVGLGSNGTADYLSQSHNDTNGIWLHKLTWARTSGLSGFIPLYWYTDDIYGKSLYHIYGDFGNFMEGIPFTNGNYVDAAGSSSNTNVRVYGQKDLTNRQAFLWIDNKTHTWWNVVNSPGSIVNQSSNITVNMGQANAQYTVTWWNTYTGAVSSTQTLTANGSGVLTLTVSNLGTDTAVKITPVGVPYIPSRDSAPMLAEAKVTTSGKLAVQEVIRQAPIAPVKQATPAPAPVASIKTTVVDTPPARSLENLSFQLASPKTKAVFHVRIPGGKIFALDAGLPDMLADVGLTVPLN